MAALFEIESRVIGGAAFEDMEDAPAFKKMGDAPAFKDVEDAPADSGHISAPLPWNVDRARLFARMRSRGRVTLKFRVSAGTARYYRWLECLFERYRPSTFAGRSFLCFLCCALIESSKRPTATQAYAHIYDRDRHRCTSPVCNRRDLTPHHLQFRSEGGDDSEENLASLCVWCHLEGIHGGRLEARPPASAMEWKIGRTSHALVRGRQRVLLVP